MMASGRTYPSLVAAMLLVGFSNQAFGQANCALRNPDRQIYEIFPEATSYRTLESEVNRENRPTLENEIGSPLAPTDLGTHSAYVVLNGTVPIGFVHARTEIGSRGSIELVWAMDIDLTIADFRVQRSRERQTNAIKSDSFRGELVGRNLTDLRDLLTSGNDDIDLAALNVPANAAGIAHTIVLCALKTRVITEQAFRDSIFPAQMLAHVHRAFADVGKVTRVRTPFSSDVLESIRQKLGRDTDQADLSTIDVLRVRVANGSEIGILVRADWNAYPENPECWWAVLGDGTMRSATIAGRKYAAVRQDFQGFQGRKLDAIDDGGETESTPSGRRFAREVLAIAAAIGGPD